VLDTRLNTGCPGRSRERGPDLAGHEWDDDPDRGKVTGNVW
jgi:hypothetical protein